MTAPPPFTARMTWGDLRHDVAHAEIGHLALSHHALLAERGDGYVDVAAEERGEEQEERRARTHAELPVCVTQHPDLNEDQQKGKGAGECTRTKTCAYMN
jgi:hypothetical protein